MKRLAAVLLHTAARLGDDGGYVFSTACSTAVYGRRRNRRRRRRRTKRRGGMERGSSWASPGGEMWGGEGSRQSGGVAAARLARWHSTEQLGGAGGGRRPRCPWWAGWAGWAGSAWATGKVFFLFLFNLSFLFFFSVVCFDFGKNTKSFY